MTYFGTWPRCARPFFDTVNFDPITLVAVGLAVAGGVAQASNTLAAGKAAQAAGLARQSGLEHQAAQARQNAGQERAASQREAMEQRRLGRLLSSRAQARAAASGAGAGDPTVENILGDIGAEGEFRALTALFVGDERALGLETFADLRVFEGDQERRAGDVARKASRGRAFAQLLGTAASAASIGAFAGGGGEGLARHGGGGPFAGRPLR